MEQWQITLVTLLAGVLVGALIPIYVKYLEFTLNKKKERWQFLLQRSLDLEGKIGSLTESLIAYKPADGQHQQLRQLLQEIETERGFARRYTEANQSLRDFLNTAGWFLESKGRFESREEMEKLQAELQRNYSKVLAALDRALEKGK